MLSNRRSFLGPSNNVVPTSLSGRPQSLPARPPPPRATEYSSTDEPHCQVPSVPTSTLTHLPGYRISRLIGTVFGISTVAKKESKGFLKTLGGAEPIGLTQMMYNARGQATERMSLDCVMRGANAIVGMTCTESEVMGCIQISVSGTAVYVEKESPYGMPPTPE